MSDTPPPPASSPPPPGAGEAAGPDNGKPWWRRWWGITAIAVTGSILIGALVGEAPEDQTDDVAAESAAAEISPSPSETSSPPGPQPTPTPTDTPSPSSTPSPTRTPSTTPTADPVAEVRTDDAPVVLTGVVANIVDGDTIDLDDGTRVRLAIVDTPEVHGGKEECGTEASTFTRREVLGEQVSILRPAGAPSSDSFDRTLGEVVRADGWSLNVGLAAAGLGTVDERFTNEDPDLAERARAAQADAPDPTCAAIAPPPPAPAPEPEPEPVAPVAPEPEVVPEPEPEPAGNCHPAYTPCVPPAPPDLNCPDVNGPIQVNHAHGDPHGFDRDGDGVGCEG